MVKSFKKSAMPDDKTSSPLGGIAFNALPIQTEAVASSALAALPGVRAFKGDMDAEWARIQAVFNAGIRPSAQRLADFAAAASASLLAGQRREDILKLIAGLLRRDEEDKRLVSMDSILKSLLNALEANSLTGITNAWRFFWRAILYPEIVLSGHDFRLIPRYNLTLPAL